MSQVSSTTKAAPRNTSASGSNESIGSSSSSLQSPTSIRLLLSAAWETLCPFLPPIPLAASVLVLIGVTQLALGLSIWTLLLHSGQHNAVVFAQDAQREVLGKAVAELQVRINAAERLVRMQRAEWDSGVLNVTRPETKHHTMRHLLDTLIMYRDMVAAYYYTTWPAGRINGWYTALNPDSGQYEYQIWSTSDSGDYLIQAADPETMQLYGDILLEEVDYSNADSLWVTQVLPARPRAPPSWTRAYGFEGGLWLSLSQATFAGPNGEFNVVASVDFDLTFMSNLLQAFLEKHQNAWSTTQSNMTLYLFEAATDTVIGSSLPTNVVLTLDVDGNERTIGIQELAMIDSRMAGVTEYIRAQNSRLGARPSWSFRVHGHFVETRVVTSLYPTSNLKWVLVQLVPDDLVDKQVHRFTELTATATGPIVAFAFLAGGLWAITLYRHMARVTRELRLLGDLDFKAVFHLYDAHWEDQDIQSRCLVTEVWQAQEAAARLVLLLMESGRERVYQAGSEESLVGNEGDGRVGWEPVKSI